VKRSIFPGLLFILLGGYLLAVNFGLKVPNMEQLWPIFPTILGLFLLFEAMTNARGAIFPGALFTLVGTFFFAFSMGYLSWSEMAILWPVFPLILGASFLALYLVKWDWGLLIPTGIFLGTGLVFMGINYGILNETVFTYAIKLWPVALIILGVTILVGHRAKATTNPES